MNPVLALVLGGASCVWEDVRELEQLMGEPWSGVVIAVNDVGSHWPRRLDHWCTVHTEFFQTWKHDRAWRGYNMNFVSWSTKLRKQEIGIVDRVCGNAWAQASSGYLAVGVAKEVGCNKVVLCGVPMTVTPHFAESTFHEPAKPWAGARTHWEHWLERADTLHGWVRSMSGDMIVDAKRMKIRRDVLIDGERMGTRALLGAPDLDWLNEVEQNAA